MEFHAATGGFTLTSSGSIAQVSTVGTNPGEVAYVIISSTVGNTGIPNPFAGTLWRFDAANDPTYTHDLGFAQESSGTFTNISTGINATGSAVLYGVLTNSQLWEQSPDFGPISKDSGFMMLSGTGSPALPAAFLSVAAEAHGPNTVYGIASDHTVWEHTAAGNTHISATLLASQIARHKRRRARTRCS